MTEANTLLILESGSYFIQFAISIKRFVVEAHACRQTNISRPDRERSRSPGSRACPREGSHCDLLEQVFKLLAKHQV